MDPRAFNEAKEKYGEEYAKLLMERFQIEPGTPRAQEIEKLLAEIVNRK